MAACRKSDAGSVYLMQQAHCLAVPCKFRKLLLFVQPTISVISYSYLEHLRYGVLKELANIVKLAHIFSLFSLSSISLLATFIQEMLQ